MLVLILADKVRHLYVFAGYPTHMWVCEQKQGCKKNRHPVVWKNMFPSMSIKYVYVYIYICISGQIGQASQKPSFARLMMI